MGRSRQDITAFSVFLAVFFGILLMTGMMNSGFHLKDDIDFVRTHKDIQDNGLTSVIADQVSDILRIRLTVVQTLHEVLRTYCFGINFMFWYIYSGVIVSVCAFLLYLFLRNLDFSFLQSLFFGFFTLLGQQGVCWWRFGTSEPIGMVFLAASLYCMAKSVSAHTGKRAYSLLFIIFTILATLSKESFLLVVPAVLLMWIHYYGVFNGKPFFSSLKDNILMVLVLTGVITVELGYIFLVIGTEHEPMARIDRVGAFLGFIRDPVSFVRDLKISIFVLLEWITFGVALLGSFLVMQAEVGENEISAKAVLKIFRQRLLFVYSVFFLILVPQIILYAKTGLGQRFWLPAFLAFSFIIVYHLRYISVSKKITRFTRTVFVALVAVVFIPRLGHTVFKTKLLADEGYATNKFTSYVINNTEKGSNVLIVADPVMNCEWSFTFPGYVDAVAGDRKFYYKLINTGRIFRDKELTRLIDEAMKDRYEKIDVDRMVSVPDLGCIAIFPRLEGLFLGKSPQWFKKNDFERRAFPYGEGSFVVYVRSLDKKSGE